MSKNKKIILGSLTMLTAFMPIIALVSSCGKYPSGDIFVVTDGSGSINDKSFNEQVMKSGEKILKRKHNYSDYVNCADASSYTISETYKVAMDLKKTYILGCGFNHDSAINRFNDDLGIHKFDKEAAGTEKIKFIMADVKSNGRKNVAGIEYKSHQAGFLAGYLAAQYLVEVKKDKTPTVGAFSGGDFHSATDQLSGFVQGVHFYNNQNNLKHVVKFAKTNNIDDMVSTGFNEGNPKGKKVITELLKNGADVILPIAGTQIVDVIDMLLHNKVKGRNFSNTKIIGVDVDMSKIYSQQSHQFLTSIVKNIKDSIFDVYDYINNGKKIKGIKGLGEDSICDLNNGLVGLSDTQIQNEQIKTLYKKLMNKSASAAIWNAAKQASDHWDNNPGNKSKNKKIIKEIFKKMI